MNVSKSMSTKPISMNSNESQTSEKLGQNLEKITIRPLLYLASMSTLAIFLLTFLPYSKFDINILPFFSFNITYILTYCTLFTLIFIALVLYYRHKSVHIETFSRYVKILGINPNEIINRTGNRKIDLIGFISGVILSIVSLIIPGGIVAFPCFLLLTMSFFFSLRFGSTNKWKLLRR
jgi:hypothetical protein